MIYYDKEEIVFEEESLGDFLNVINKYNRTNTSREEKLSLRKYEHITAGACYNKRFRNYKLILSEYVAI